MFWAPTNNRGTRDRSMDCKVVMEMRTPSQIPGARPEEQDRVLDHKGDTLKMVSAIPPQEGQFYSWSPGDHHGRVYKASASKDASPGREERRPRRPRQATTFLLPAGQKDVKLQSQGQNPLLQGESPQREAPQIHPHIGGRTRGDQMRLGKVHHYVKLVTKIKDFGPCPQGCTLEEARTKQRSDT